MSAMHVQHLLQLTEETQPNRGGVQATAPLLYPFQYYHDTNIHTDSCPNPPNTTMTRVLASRVSGCLFDTLVHEKYLFWGEKTPYLLVCFFENMNYKYVFKKVLFLNDN